MKKFNIFFSFFAASLSLLMSCSEETSGQGPSSFLLATDSEPFSATSPSVARMLAALPIDNSHLAEVYDAVCNSSGKGYDEEYMFRDVLDASSTKSGKGLGSLIREYLDGLYSTKGGGAGQLADELASSGLQIYWPYSDNWDGEQMPYVTYDPGYGLESNYAYRLGDKTDSVLVDEAYAENHPVWVVNTNSDDGFQPIFVPGKAKDAASQQPNATYRRLVLKSFTMLRSYDTWFGGASEFWIKCGAVDGFSASTEAELKLYYPSVTDFLVVVKRKYLRKELPLDALILTDFSNQLEKLAFLVTEDDGGNSTSWKCTAVVKIKSKSYGLELELPYNDKDDIVWRGQLSASFFQEADEVQGRFGDVVLKFALE